jgi:hypothetical protein
MTKRTTHRSPKGTKLYTVRDTKGQFKDIQTNKRAHGTDVKRKSSEEESTGLSDLPELTEWIKQR